MISFVADISCLFQMLLIFPHLKHCHAKWLFALDKSLKMRGKMETPVNVNNTSLLYLCSPMKYEHTSIYAHVAQISLHVSLVMKCGLPGHEIFTTIRICHVIACNRVVSTVMQAECLLEFESHGNYGVKYVLKVAFVTTSSSVCTCL